MEAQLLLNKYFFKQLVTYSFDYKHTGALIEWVVLNLQISIAALKKQKIVNNFKYAFGTDVKFI
jgi:hypothetical protein